MAGKKGNGPGISVRILFSVLILMAGAAAMTGLKAMKVPPREAVRSEQAVRVKTLVARPRNVAVSIQGFGEVKPLNTVSIAPEVAGTIVAVHPRLEVGEIIEKGALLFAVDPVNYQSALDQALAVVAQREKTVARLREEFRQEGLRLATLKRNRDLAQAEFVRVSDLFKKNRVGTRSGVDKVEQTYNAARDLVDQMNRMLTVYPLQIKETESALAAARASLDLAAANLQRCRITAPFTGRLKTVDVEKGAYASPGQNVLTLADDSLLEIHVPLDSRDVSQWLQFEENGEEPATDQLAWFSRVKPVPVAIHWTENPTGTPWTGQLHRTLAFDPATRTVTVAVRIKAQEAMAKKAFPLVAGMFCSVSIPGKALTEVISLPRWAVTFENTVYAVKEGRLKTLHVTVARTQGEETYVSQGIEPGDEIIITRLVDPLENGLLDIIDAGDGA
ncbi:efflux RND transporter periplasmic adaptor subunit [Desulfocicer niacini]